MVSAGEGSGTHVTAMTGHHFTGPKDMSSPRERICDTWYVGPTEYQWDGRRLKTPRGGVRDGVRPSMERLHWEEGVAMRREPSHPHKVRGPDLPAMQCRQARLWNFALGDYKRPRSSPYLP